MNDETMKTGPHTLKFFGARRPTQYEKICDVIANAVRGRVVVCTKLTAAQYSAQLQRYGFETQAQGDAVIGTLRVANHAVPFRIEVCKVASSGASPRAFIVEGMP